jgi:hypothetical protein
MRHVMLSRDSDVGIWDLTNLGFSKKVIAQLKDRERQVMAVGQIVLVSDDPLPGGVESGDFIEFECGRIDLW